MAEHSKTIYIRHGLNGFPYAAYTENWRFIANFRHLRDARKHWQKEIKLGLVRLVRDLQAGSGRPFSRALVLFARFESELHGSASVYCRFKAFVPSNGQ